MKRIIILLVPILISSLSFAQSVGIGTTTPDSSAILDLKSNSKGLLIPRMTTAQRDSLHQPAPGLQILNLDDHCIDIYDGTYWIKNCGMKITGMDTITSIWSYVGEWGGAERQGAVAFTIGSKGYIGTGWMGSNPTLDFWEFDPVTNIWTQKANVAYQPRMNGSGFVVNGKGYIGLGQYNDNEFLSDMNEYDPVANTWTQKASLPSQSRHSAAAFSLGDDGYIAGGFFSDFPYDQPTASVWKYTPATNTWIQAPSLPWLLADGVGFSIGSKVYVGTGFSKSPFGGPVFTTGVFYKFENGAWTTVSSFGGGNRYGVTGFSHHGNGYVGTGRSGSGINKKDMWKLDTLTHSWTQIGDFGGIARYSAVGFAIGDKGYIGTGAANSGLQGNIWQLDIFPQGPVYEAGLPAENAASISDVIWTKAIDKIFMTDPQKLGISTSAPSNFLDVSDGIERSGSHPANRSLYVTGEIGDVFNGVEFRHHNGQQGIGFGYNGIYATGSNDSQSLSLNSRGDAGLGFNTNGVQRLLITGSGNTGLGLNTPGNFLDVSKYSREGAHPSGLSLYVTGDFLADSNGVEFRHLNGTQGVGFGFNTIYAAGANTNQDLGMSAKGTGHLIFKTNDAERMKITETGSVGVGINPTNKLDILSESARTGTHPSGLPLYVTSNTSSSSSGVEFRHNNGLQGVGFGFNTIYATGSIANQDLGLSSRGTGNLIFSTNGVERFRVTGSGNIGIGNSSPNAPLQFSNTLQNRKIVLWDAHNTDNEFFGFGVNASILRYQVTNTINDHVFYAGTSATTSNELMFIKGNGNVGIGVSPVNRLDIQHGTSRTGVHPTGKSLYVTGDFGSGSNGIEFRHNNGAEGIGFGFNTVYATGNNASQYLGMAAKGPAGHLFFVANDTVRALIKPNGNTFIQKKLEIGYQRISAFTSIPGLSTGTVQCNCPAGTVVLGGGFDYSTSEFNNAHILESYPNSDTSWLVKAHNFDFDARNLTGYAICARLGL